MLGPNWRLEPLGGMLGNRLKDYSANGYLQVKLSIGTQSLRFEADPARPGTYVAQDGGTVVRNADGSFTQSGGPDGLTYVWRTVGTDLLITSIGGAATGAVLIGYDAHGRISRITAPASEQDDCTVPNAAGCASATFGYATSTTATATQLGDVAGQLKQIDRTAAGATTPVTVVRYAYDQLKRLREVRDVRQVDGDPVLVSAYTYDTKGNITRLNTPQEGVDPHVRRTGKALRRDEGPGAPGATGAVQIRHAVPPRPERLLGRPGADGVRRAEDPAVVEADADPEGRRRGHPRPLHVVARPTVRLRLPQRL